ncbi:MAG TPA: response regulator [Fibrobacteria bacterium]|nr:response regulator [Fibrobacteria bacterium]
MSDKYILLVEDDPNDELLTLHALQENRIKNKVIVARDGVEALDFLFSTGPHAGKDLPGLPQFVLLDLKMPRLNGIEVLQQLREHPKTKLLPVIIFTSSKEEKDMISSYRLGANSYVRKPVDFVEFAAAVKELDLYWMILNEKAPD